MLFIFKNGSHSSLKVHQGGSCKKAFRSHIWFPAMGTKAGGVFLYKLLSPFFSDSHYACEIIKMLIMEKNGITEWKTLQ